MTMKLYYSPGACSLADHIALEETGLAYDAVRVDLKTRTTETGEDFTAINPKGYVPALGLDDGETLTENIAILSYIADKAGALMPPSGIGHWRVLETTAFISTELHKNFKPFFNPAASEAEKDEAKETLAGRFGLMADRLGDRAFMVGEEMSIADCYLFVMLMWATGKVGMSVPDPLQAYFDRLKLRPAVARALSAEGLDAPA
jgi:glutathione S-transferase